jgi:hypothetical protein
MPEEGAMEDGVPPAVEERVSPSGEMGTLAEGRTAEECKAAVVAPAAEAVEAMVWNLAS